MSEIIERNNKYMIFRTTCDNCTTVFEFTTLDLYQEMLVASGSYFRSIIADCPNCGAKVLIVNTDVHSDMLEPMFTGRYSDQDPTEQNKENLKSCMTLLC